MKLIWKILLPSVCLTAFLISASGFIAYKQSSSSLTTATIENMHDEAAAVSKMTNLVMGNSLDNIKRIADAAGSAGQHVTESLISALKIYPEFDRLNFLDMNGDIIASTDKSAIGNNFKSREYFTVAAGGRTFIAEPLKSAITKRSMLIMSAPVMDNGKIQGVITANMDLDKFYSKVMSDIRIGSQGYAYIINKKGLIVAHPDESLIFKEGVENQTEYLAMASTKDGAHHFVNHKKEPVLAYHVANEQTGMIIVVQALEDDVLSSLQELSQMTVIIIGLSVVLGSVLFFFLIHYLIARPLVKSVAFAEAIAQGDLEQTLNINRKDEIGKLADSLRFIPSVLKQIAGAYNDARTSIQAGDIGVNMDSKTFTGAFAGIVNGTNLILAQLQSIIDSMSSPIMIFDKAANVIYLNAAAKKISDYAKSPKWKESSLVHDKIKEAGAGHLVSGEGIIETAVGDLDATFIAIPLKNENGIVMTILFMVSDITEIRKAQRIVAKVSGQAEDIAVRLASSAGELLGQIGHINTGAQSQQSLTGSVATAMSEMTSTIIEVARSASSASEEAEQMSKKAEEGVTSVEKVVGIIKKVDAAAQNLDVNMGQLGVQAEAIGAVLNVISDIADRTNLLALNAAIEAARAGDAGRGFAIVADEVRKLAEKTMLATKDVGDKIGDIQSSAKKSIAMVSETASFVRDATKTASSSGEMLYEIQTLVDNSRTLVTGIATAAEEQSATSEEINASIANVDKIATETAGRIGNSAKAINALSAMADELKTLLEQLRGLSK